MSDAWNRYRRLAAAADADWDQYMAASAAARAAWKQWWDARQENGTSNTGDDRVDDVASVDGEEPEE